MTHPTCKTCKHFNPEPPEWDVPKHFGTCLMMPHSWEMMGWNADYSSHDMRPFFLGHLASVCDASAYKARLHCAPDFYCAMHSDMKPDLNPFSEYDYKDHSNGL